MAERRDMNLCGTPKVGSLLYSTALKHALSASSAVLRLPHLNNFQWSLEHCLGPLFQYASELGIYKKEQQRFGLIVTEAGLSKISWLGFHKSVESKT